MDETIVITGASRGIGRALAHALAHGVPAPARLVLVARSASELEAAARDVRGAGVGAVCVPADLSTREATTDLAARVAEHLTAPATLVHNAGLWPPRRELTADGLERAFAVNCVCPLALQRDLIARGVVRRVMVVGAGLMVKGRFDEARTPTGEDFSSWRTYCNTKLAFALATRDASAAHPDVDFVVLHPGVVRTDLGARPGLLGAVLRLAKRSWETPETCAARLREVLGRPRWSPPGDARWLFEGTEQPWPAVADDETARRAVRQALSRALTNEVAQAGAAGAQPSGGAYGPISPER
jgi:NAD(P)-dependent dehydrogenase (short-subunit alcohol dehydrogenase family)